MNQAQTQTQIETSFTRSPLYLAFRADWKAACAKGEHIDAAMMAAYCLLKGRALNTAFSPAIRQSKILSGGYNGNPWAMRDAALCTLSQPGVVHQLLKLFGFSSPNDYADLIAHLAQQAQAALKEAQNA